MSAFMSLRDRHRAATRAALMAAAEEEFRTAGFEGASIRAIARRAGIASGTVFNYAPSKVDLLHQVLHERLEDTVQAALQVPQEPALIDQLAAIAGCFFDHYAADAALSRVLLERSLLAGGARGQAFRAQVETVAQDVAERLRRAQRQGRLDRALDLRAATLGFVSAYYFSLLRMMQQEVPDSSAARQGLRLQLGLWLMEVE